MKKALTALLLAAIPVASSSNAKAAHVAFNPMDEFTENISASLSTDFKSENVYRGQKRGQSNQQTAFRFTYNAIEADNVNTYGKFWTLHHYDSNSANEVDFNVGMTYTPEIWESMITMDGGYTYYWFPGQGQATARPIGYNHSNEIYVGMSADVIFSPSVYFFWDFDLEQYVVEGSIEYTLPLQRLTYMEDTENFSIDLRAQVAHVHANRQYGIGGRKNGYSYWGFSAETNYVVNEDFHVGAGVYYMGNDDGHTGNSINLYQTAVFSGNGSGDRPADMFWWGVHLTFAF